MTEARNNPPGTDQDSDYTIQTVDGTKCYVLTTNPFGADSYLYYIINASETQFLSATTVYLTVRYYDASKGGTLSADYDSSDTSAPVNGAYENTGSITLGGTSTWKTQTWKLTNALFQGKENGNADFRLDGTPGVQIAEVILSLTPPAS